MTISEEVGGREARVPGASAAVPVCRIEDVAEDKGLPDEQRVKLAEYLSNFQPPKYDERKNVVCPKCGNSLLGFFGSFTWGLAHGEGFCSGQGLTENKKCGWPVRMSHFLDFISEGARLDYPLAYHPSLVKRRKAGE